VHARHDSSEEVAMRTERISGIADDREVAMTFPEMEGRVEGADSSG
jgi:hypothetical protein